MRRLWPFDSWSFRGEWDLYRELDILVKNMAPFCPWPENLSKAKFKGDERIYLTEEVSLQKRIPGVAGLPGTTCLQVHSGKEQKCMQKYKNWSVCHGGKDIKQVESCSQGSGCEIGCKVNWKHVAVNWDLREGTSWLLLWSNLNLFQRRQAALSMKLKQFPPLESNSLGKSFSRFTTQLLMTLWSYGVRLHPTGRICYSLPHGTVFIVIKEEH